MRELTNDLLRELLEAKKPPCFSIYMPTGRHHPGTGENPLRFRALMEKLEESLGDKYDRRESKPLLDALWPYVKDSHFWNHQLDGVAFFVSPGEFHIVELQRAVPELAIVSDSYHVSPLLRIVQSADRYHVLCLSQKQVRLFEGNRYRLDEVELEHVPHNIVEFMAWAKQDPKLLAAGGEPMETLSVHKPKGEFPSDFDIKVEQYFRAVDLAVFQHHTQPTGLPLILAALGEYQPMFRKVSKNRLLLEKGLNINPDFIATERLRDEAWALFEPQYQQRISSNVDAFHVASAQQAGSDDIQKVAEAAADGKIQTLLIEADRHIAGKLQGRGKVHFGPSDTASDVLDDIAERVLRTGGQVFVIPPEQMPTGTGMAATYRY